LDISDPFEFVNDREEITGKGNYGEIKEGRSIEFKFIAR